jgi:O-antigen ligase
VFVAIAFLSVVLNAQYLNHIGELTLTVKRLPYLLAYIVLFLIVSTAIRPTEVRAFMTLSLALTVIVAVGIIWEYRFTTNIFRLIADRIAVGPLTFVGDSVSSTALDSQGRRGISGPAQVGLEAVSMMALGLPIAVLRLSSAKGRKRLIYAAAVCLLIGGIFATGRKSGFIAPVAVFATLAYFRRRELLRLAPIGLVMAIVVTAASPDVVRGVLTQFTASDRGNVATTSDRVADYDAVRPDVWTHLMFGRGFGSYNPDTYRLLDSEILSRVIETGVIGLLAFLGIAVTVVLAGRRTIARRESEFASHALVGAVAGVVFVVVSTLFDVTAFPHVTYIFFFIAALASLSIGYEAPDPSPEERGARGRRLHRTASSSLDASPEPSHTLV